MEFKELLALEEVLKRTADENLPSLPFGDGGLISV